MSRIRTSKILVRGHFIMDVTLGVLADYASVSQEGKLNIMGVFGEINPLMLPFQLPSMHLVLIFEASPAEFDTEKSIKIVLLNADGKQILTIEQSLKIPKAKRPGNKAIINANFALNGVKFEQSGDYAFSVLVGGEEKRSIPLHINEPVKGGK